MGTENNSQSAIYNRDVETQNVGRIKSDFSYSRHNGVKTGITEKISSNLILI